MHHCWIRAMRSYDKNIAYLKHIFPQTILYDIRYALQYTSIHSNTANVLSQMWYYKSPSISLDCEFLKQPLLLWLYSNQYASHASTIDPPSHVCSSHLEEAGWIVSALQQISEMHKGFHLPLPVDRLQQDSETPMCVRNKFHLPSICDSSANKSCCNHVRCGDGMCRN